MATRIGKQETRRRGVSTLAISGFRLAGSDRPDADHESLGRPGVSRPSRARIGGAHQHRRRLAHGAGVFVELYGLRARQQLQNVCPACRNRMQRRSCERSEILLGHCGRLLRARRGCRTRCRPLQIAAIAMAGAATLSFVVPVTGRAKRIRVGHLSYGNGRHLLSCTAARRARGAGSSSIGMRLSGLPRLERGPARWRCRRSSRRRSGVSGGVPPAPSSAWALRSSASLPS